MLRDTRYSSGRIQRTAYASRAVTEDVGVDHGRGHLPVTEELLDSADVVSAFQKVGGERMAEGVATGTLLDAGRLHGAGHGALNVRLVVVMPAFGRLALPPRRVERPIASASRAPRPGTSGRWHPVARPGRNPRPGLPDAARPRERVARSGRH